MKLYDSSSSVIIDPKFYFIDTLQYFYFMMKNIISKIALASTLLGGSILGLSTPSSAGTCWFENELGTSLTPTYCWHRVRTNANGHRVVDVRDWAGTEFTLVFWEEGVVEMIFADKSLGAFVGDWYIDNEGDYRINNRDGWEMAFSTQNPN